MVEPVDLSGLVNDVVRVARDALKAQDTRIETGSGHGKGWFAVEAMFEFIDEISISGVLRIDKRQIWARSELHPLADGLVELCSWGCKPLRLDPDPDVIARLIFARAWCENQRVLDAR